MIADACSSALSLFSGQVARSGSPDVWAMQNVFGGARTKSGAVVTLETADKISAVWRATRVLSEGVASLPLSLRKVVNAKNTETAYDHPLHRLLHDSPNPEQNSFTFFDTLVPLQVNSGNAFAEIQRDYKGSVVALWPIHSTRIPAGNILRVTAENRKWLEVGQEGEIVYLVKNNDGSRTPIPARDMLHVPGIMSGDGITGKGVITAAAETLGIIQSSESYVSSFFRNGATPDFVLTVPASATPEARAELRKSWINMHAGADNGHNMMVVGGDSKVQVLGFDPDKSQLLESRQFSIEEVSRFWGVPKHKLSSTDGAKYNSLELLNQSFLVESLTPWLIRWEKALNTQLLTQKEQETLFFKFNINALMRGDSAARSQYYQRMFDMGVMSIDEIRELEDMNPLPNEMGDRYFILANNRVPLDRIDDIAQLQGGSSKTETSEKESASVSEPSLTVSDMRSMVREAVCDAVAGMVVYETNRIKRAAENRQEFFSKVDNFYADGKFRELFTRAVEGSLSRAGRLGSKVSAEFFVEQHITTSLTDLKLIEDRPVREFVSAVQETLERWQGRAESESQSIFN